MTDILGQISQALIPTVVVAGLVVGYLMKKFLPTDNKFIPLTLAVVGLVLGGLINGWTAESLINGALSGLASVGLHQAFTRLIEGKQEKKEEEKGNE